MRDEVLCAIVFLNQLWCGIYEGNMTDQSEPAVGQSGSDASQNAIDKSERVKQDNDVTGTCPDTHDEADGGADELPFPGFVPVAFKYMDQGNIIRFWCLRIIMWPYPFINCTCSFFRF